MGDEYKYVPWGFKLNMMYASIPPAFYRNLHNFNEYNAPRVDIGMLTGSMYEQSIYGPRSQCPHHAEAFYRARKAEIEKIVKKLFLDVKLIENEEGMAFPGDYDFFKFVSPSVEVDLGQYVANKIYPFFVCYTSSDSVGNETETGYPFLHVLCACLKKSSGTGNKYRWQYHEYCFGCGDAEYQYKPFLAGPMYIAYLLDEYTALDFDANSERCLNVYERHSAYFKVESQAKSPFDSLINRESIGKPNEYGEFAVIWDGVAAPRSIVVSQTYYDWDDDLQSAHVDAQITRRLERLEQEILQLKNILAKNNVG